MTKIFSEMLLLLQLHILLGLRQLCRLQRDEHNTLSCCLAYPARPSRCHLMILLHVNVTGNQKNNCVSLCCKRKNQSFYTELAAAAAATAATGAGTEPREACERKRHRKQKKTTLVLYFFFKRKNRSFYTEQVAAAAAAAATAATGAGAEPREAYERKRHRNGKKLR